MTDEDCGLIPKAKRQAAQEWRGDRIYISGEARGLLEFLKQHMREHPAWLGHVSNSTIIEFLAEYWLSKGELSMTKFKARTRRPGRPVGVNVYENFRAANVRKAAGLSKTDVRVGQKPPGG